MCTWILSVQVFMLHVNSSISNPMIFKEFSRLNLFQRNRAKNTVSSPLYLCRTCRKDMYININHRLTNNLYLNAISPFLYVSLHLAGKHRFICFCRIVKNQCCWITATDVEMLLKILSRIYRSYSWRCFLANSGKAFKEYDTIKYFTR